MAKYIVTGKAQNIKRGNDKTWSFLTFNLVDLEDEQGIEFEPVFVEVIGYQIIGSKINEGDIIQIELKKNPTTLSGKSEKRHIRCNRVKNVSTGEEVNANDYFEGTVRDVRERYKLKTHWVSYLPIDIFGKREYEQVILTFVMQIVDYGTSDAIAVEMRGRNIDGQITDGDIVRVKNKRKKNKPIRAGKVINLSTGIKIKA
jgi:hypothetical protein